MTIPEEYGGHGLGITEATLLLEEVARSGAAMNGASAIHLSIFGMQPVVKHGSDELKARTLPRIVNGDLHVCFGVTEPGAGLDTSRITTFAKREGTTTASTAARSGSPRRLSPRRSCYSPAPRRTTRSPRRPTA